MREYLRVPRTLEDWFFVVATLAAVLIDVSIAASQVCLAAAVILLLLSARRLAFPRVWLPLLCFFIWTLAADFASGEPLKGWPQIKKFFVFLFLPVMFYFAKELRRATLVVLGWIVAGTLSALISFAQFVWKLHIAHITGRDFYLMYTERRITGFEGHWMTFGGLELAVLSTTMAHWLFARKKFPAWLYALAVASMMSAIVLSWTRSIWIAMAPSLIYLVWMWRPKWVVAVPLVIAAAFAVSPHTTKERLESLVHPHGDNDSNRHRIVTFETGVAMIKAHPWFGLGPEEVKDHFDQYVPANVRRPLPTGYYGHLHDIYVQFPAERGLPGLAFLLWFIGLAVYDFLRAVRGKAPSLEKMLLHGAVAVTIGILIGGCFEYNLGDSEVLMMFVSVMGLAYAASIQQGDLNHG